MEGPGSVVRVLTRPRRLLRHLRRFALGDGSGLSNRYGTSSRPADIALVSEALGLDVETVEECFAEIEGDASFVAELQERYRGGRREWANTFDLGRFKILYALVRLSKAKSVLETGVHDGLSTALLLRALERNGHGSLTSIDLPGTDLPLGAEPGWLVPERLKARWTLLLGDSRRLLGPAAGEAAPLDLFIHDSDHSRAHREFEFRTVRPCMAPSGLIVSDDDEPGDTLLDELAAEWSMAHRTNHVPGASGPGVGLLVPGRPEPAGTASTRKG